MASRRIRERAERIDDALCAFCLNPADFWVAEMGSETHPEEFNEWTVCLFCMRPLYQITKGQVRFVERSRRVYTAQETAASVIEEVERLIGYRTESTD